MKRRASIVLIGAVASVLLTSSAAAAPAPELPAPVTEQASDADLRQQLVDRFAPVMVLKQQEEPCDEDGEPFRPSVVDIVLDNPEVALRQVGGGDPTVMRAPGASDLFELGEGFFIDFPGSSLEPGCIYERDFNKYSGDRPASVYAHIVQQPDEPGLLFVQYWFYWYYNDWNNKHESDWEGIMLKFEASSVEEALASEPTEIGFAQHVGGERAGWNDSKLERVGDHPVVYSAARSHASYYGEALYLGRSASEGFGCDNTSGPSDRVETEVVLLPDTVDDPNDPLAWLAYNGRWGERQSGSFNAPNGPAAKARWLEPAPWFEDLRDAAVVIPTGDSQAATVVSLFCTVVAAGSSAFVDFTVSPTRVLIALGLIVGLVAFLMRRTQWQKVVPVPIVRRRRAGQIVRAAVQAYRREPFAYVVFGLVYIPAVIVAGLLTVVVSWIPFVDALRQQSGSGDGTSLVMAMLIGSFANLGAFVVVNSLVADHLERGLLGVRSAVESVRRVWERRRAVAGAFLRTFGIVFALLLTTIGAPWGIWLLVRYQFVPHVVILEDLDGGAALRRSSYLVRHRWFHTATIVTLLNGLVIVIASVFGLLLLLLVSGLPWWTFSIIISAVYAVLVPLAAIATTLLYGDALAERQGDPRAEPILETV